jgi:hypothetical protein
MSQDTFFQKIRLILLLTQCHMSPFQIQSRLSPEWLSVRKKFQNVILISDAQYYKDYLKLLFTVSNSQRLFQRNVFLLIKCTLILIF